MNRVCGCTVLTLVLLAGLPPRPVVAQAAPDLLDQARARQEIEIQRIEQAVKDADRTAGLIGRNDPAQAVQILKTALATVEASPDVPEARKATLKRKLELSLRAFQGRIVDASRQNPVLPAIDDARRHQEIRQRQEAAQIERSLAEIRSLRAAGRTWDARQMQDDLHQRFPNTPAVQAGGLIGSRNDALADNRRFQDQRQTGYLGVQREIERANIPVTRDYNLPADWVEKSKRRSPAMQLTKTERAILEALNKPISPNFDGQTFGEVISYLEKVIGQPIIVPQGALTEAQITSETPVRLKAERVTVRTVLKKVLAEVGLAYIIKDQTIQVTTQRGALETLSTRTYYVGDLVSVVNVNWGPFVNQFQAVQNIYQLMNMIVQTIDPLSWQANGGLGRIAFDPISMSIVVRQTAEVHMMLGIGLR